MFALDVASVAELALGNVWIGGWLWVSMSAFSTLFVGTALLLRRRGLRYFEVLAVSLTTMVSMIWLYELFYHLGFWIYWGYSKPPWVFGDYNEAALIDLLLFSVGIVGVRYMRMGWVAGTLFASFFAAFVVWVMMGYPQLSSPGMLFPFGTVLIHVSDPGFWAYWLNVLTKYLLALAYLSLFVAPPSAKRVLAAEPQIPAEPL